MLETKQAQFVRFERDKARIIANSDSDQTQKKAVDNLCFLYSSDRVVEVLSESLPNAAVLMQDAESLVMIALKELYPQSIVTAVIASLLSLPIEK